jgi:hypothetical protein
MSALHVPCSSSWATVPLSLSANRDGTRNWILTACELQTRRLQSFTADDDSESVMRVHALDGLKFWKREFQSNGVESPCMHIVHACTGWSKSVYTSLDWKTCYSELVNQFSWRVHWRTFRSKINNRTVNLEFIRNRTMNIVGVSVASSATDNVTLQQMTTIDNRLPTYEISVVTTSSPSQSDSQR